MNPCGWIMDESLHGWIPADGRQHVWCHVGERLADVNVVNKVPRGDDGVMVWAGISYRQWTQWHLIDGNLKGKGMHRPAYSSDMSHIEHVQDALDRRVQQCILVHANIQQLRTAIEEECYNIPQATINSLINSMRRRYVALHGANGGNTRHCLVFWSTPLTFFCDQQKRICIPSHVKSID